MNTQEIILSGKTALGIEFGSTRIKAILSDYEGNVLASGSYDWENQLIDGIWTYSLDKVREGMQSCYAELRRDILEKYFPKKSGEEITEIIYVFFPFMFGIYPYAEVTAKQKAAMKTAEVDYKNHTIYEITYNCLVRLLK